MRPVVIIDLLSGVWARVLLENRARPIHQYRVLPGISEAFGPLMPRVALTPA
ncbi:hypothetical protein SIAM614_03925 [Roseibium aggregatum IAM 12614]|uniref:Uncharacterized protein n=1 Tax=Roseibium aggregatum (strain ATCC 25650 / DSM 13394 / JCM 20685 / NBRC 16684 / NCIMB 2208 / IAM 12614 / B1) TaxID=384765 RepID=A0NRU8_ROSAI|nr:hypothetical protein SIAM614_03925 [Roseibium aggregatum IAM 12614]